VVMLELRMLSQTDLDRYIDGWKRQGQSYIWIQKGKSVDVYIPKDVKTTCKSNKIHKPRVKARGIQYECLNCGETW